MATNPTASSLERVLECPGSAALPSVYESSPYADRGTCIARFIRNIIAGMSMAGALALVREEWRATCEHLDFTKLCGDLHDVRGEVAYALDTATDATRVLGINLGRNYPALLPTEIGGTDDIEGVRIDGVPVVADVKTGQPVTPCADNPQVKFFARILQLRTGAPEVEGRILYVREDGFVTQDCHLFTAYELDSYGDDLAELVERVASARAQYAKTGSVNVSTGDHCRYCASKPACPRYVGLARTMVADVESIASQLAIMTPEQQGIAWDKARAIEGLLDHVVTGLKELARANPIPLANGKILKETKSHTTGFDRDGALVMLRRKGATDAEIAALYSTTSTFPVRAVNDTSKPKVTAKRKKKSEAA